MFMQMTSPQWQNLEQREAYQRLIETVAVLHRLAIRLSSRAEIVGAVRQVLLYKPLQMDSANTENAEKMKHCMFYCFKYTLLFFFFRISYFLFLRTV